MARRFPGVAYVGEPWRWALAVGGQAALAFKGGAWAWCKLDLGNLRELGEVLHADPAAWGWNEDQFWTLAGIVRRRFGVDYTLKLEGKTAENTSSAAGRFIM